MAVETLIMTGIGWFVAPLIVKLYEKYFPLINCSTTVKNLRTLEHEILPKLHIVIELAENLHAIPHGLETWLTELKDAARKVEVVLEEQNFNRNNKRAKTGPSKDQKVHPSPSENPHNSDSDSSLNDNGRIERPVLRCKDLKKSVEELTKIGRGVDDIISLLNLCMNSKMNRSMTVNPHSSISFPPPIVYGRAYELETLVGSLISKHDENHDPIKKNWRVPLVAIHGVGGAGKTTLAQYVFNNHQINDHFGDYRMWVHVSRNFDVMTVTRKIIESATRAECPQLENLEAIQRKLGEILRSEKFLLVLDDVWYEDWKDMEQLEQLLHPLITVGGNESRILITTRTKRAASVLGAKTMICLKDLDAKACMSIVKFYAFGGKDHVQNPYLAQLIDEKIVNKPKMSPLAAKMLGTQLGSTDDAVAWRMILKGDMLQQNIDFLLRTYKHLPWNLQQCFAITSLIPEGWKFKRKDLAKLWMDKGLIERSRNKEERLVGWPYFDDLLSYSFIQTLDEKEDNGEKLYNINGQLHKLAERISKDDSFRIEGDHNKLIPDKFLHISIDALEPEKHISKIFKHAYLRTIVFISENEAGNILCKELDEKYKELQRFQLLHFKAMRM